MRRSWIVLPVLAVLQLVNGQCDINGKKANQVPFPNIESEGHESYQLSVEYNVPGSSESVYFTEYYDILERRGRVDVIQDGKTSKYIYRTSSWEAWEVTDDACTLKNITDTPNMMKYSPNDWLYLPGGVAERRIFGPSAMLKIAYDKWNTSSAAGKMAYMGAAESRVRGLDAVYWRLCSDDAKSRVDYFFAAGKDQTAFGSDVLKKVPLRVLFAGKRSDSDAALSVQQYEITSFQPFISIDVQPFQLPKGRGCKRGYVEDAPDLPDFSGKNLMFSAEAIYRKVDRSGADVQYWSYYSTLKFALDLTSQHISYIFSPWDTSKTATDEPDVKSLEQIIFDTKHGYAYRTTLEDGQCQIIRDKAFKPLYQLPENAGSIDLTDPMILFPNNEFSYITEGINRGLKVNIFEVIEENFRLNKKDKDVKIPKAIISRSYLQDSEIERNIISVKNALTQVQLRFSGRYDKVIEILTFNFFGFSTEIRNRRSAFNIKRCFKNDDDYLWATIAFNADDALLQRVKDDVPSIQANILNNLQLSSELNPVRIPIMEVDISDSLYVSLMILGKPPVMLDFLDPVQDMKITGTVEIEGVSEVETCASRCLETEVNCWGFSICGGLCAYGASDSAKPTAQKNCKLYRRYDNSSFIQSKELLVENLKRQVQEGSIKLMLKDKDDKMVQLEAKSISVTDPGEDDRLFNRLGNKLDPRMRVLKAGYKLKSSAGSTIKNMGKLRYDECQRICAEFKDCETISYCLANSECIINKAYGDDIPDTDMEENNMCNVVTRKYAEHFGRSPGNVLTVTAKEVLDLNTVEKCARACLKQTKYNCLSFDHCPSDDKASCKLHTVYYPNSKTREEVQTKSIGCGHYFRKFSTQFKKNPGRRTVGSQLPPLSNMTLEECSKACYEYGKGTCFGFDFCQGSTMLATSCILLDSDPSQLKHTDSDICTNYLRTEPQFAPRPYSNSYAGGIGFLCFLIGGLVGVAIVFGIAYLKVNRR